MLTIMPGLKAALNYHPIFVHFPIAFWLAALLFESLGVWLKRDEMHRTGVRLLYLGTLVGVITVLSGLAAQKSVPPGPAQDVMEFHETVMLVTFTLSAALCLFAYLAGKNFTARLRKLFLLGLLVLAILLTIGTDHGADLVYQYGAAVNWPSVEQQRR